MEERCNDSNSRSTLYVVGTGPGGRPHMTAAAVAALENSDVVVGYATYLEQIPELLGGKKIVSTGMTQEVDRCRMAVELAESGRSVSVVSGGDPGIYAMAGLVIEIAESRDSRINIEIIPGIAAINACASRLGAPLMTDFAAISLSDLLTPWEKITQRLEAAASADFVIALYNPKSKRRTEHIASARDIMLKHRGAETPVGIVTGATRDNETVTLTTLGEMLSADIGMQSTVIIGNSTTRRWRDFLITPRGYDRKYDI